MLDGKYHLLKVLLELLLHQKCSETAKVSREEVTQHVCAKLAMAGVVKASRFHAVAVFRAEGHLQESHHLRTFDLP
jgi:hypothetical protein